MISEKLDEEFKMFMRWRGITIDGQLFDLVFNEPQNFAQYSQADVDSARIGTFTQLEQFPYFSKRFLMKRYLGMSEQEMSENEVMWAEETGEAAVNDGTDIDSAAGLRSVGITPGGIDTDLESVSMPELGGKIWAVWKCLLDQAGLLQLLLRLCQQLHQHLQAYNFNFLIK